MVQLMLAELPRAAPDIALHHVNLQLSSAGGDIGRWQPTKLLAARQALRVAHATVARHHCDTLYYVPAPGKRIALWRDLLLLRSLRPRVPRLILHWHASGLGDWLETKAMTWERRAAKRWLGRADLSIALAASLVTDVEKLSPKNSAIVPNGIPDPFGDDAPPRRGNPDPARPKRILFMGSGSESKGLFRTIEALAHLPDSFSLTFAGEFPDAACAQRFAAAAQRFGDRVLQAGFVDAAGRRELLATHDVLSFPTTYAHEAFPLVLIEALAADLPIVTSRWRAIPELLPADIELYADPNSSRDLAAKIQTAIKTHSPGQHRSYYENHYTSQTFANRLATALQMIAPPS